MLAPMPRLAVPASLVLALTLTACSGGEPDDTMPGVVGKKLDVAQSDVQRAGYEDEVEVVGGGVFGVVVESNWTVCSQLPEAGTAISEQPRLTVERACEDETSVDEDPTPSEPSGEEAEPEEPESEDGGDDVLTVGNSADLKSLLKAPDSCHGSVAAFIKEYEGATIRFDGSVADVANHGDYDTRFDILLYPGDAGAQSMRGPAFQFRDVNRYDLNLSGPNVPDGVRVGDKFTFTAEVVGEFYPNRANWNCLLQLDPVVTETRR